MEKEAEVVLVAMDQAKAAAEEHEVVLKNITKEYNALVALVDTVKTTEVDLTTSLEKFSQVLSIFSSLDLSNVCRVSALVKKNFYTITC